MINKKIIAVVLTGVFVIGGIALNGVVTNLSSEAMRENLSSQIEDHVAKNATTYLMSSAFAESIGENEGSLDIITQSVAENLTRAEIEALASEIAKESASSITNELLSGREIFDSQALIDEINALIDNKIGSDYLTQEDLNKLKADILQSASDTISDELDAVLDKSLIELSNNMTINSEEKSSFISNLESEILNYINSDPSLKGVDGKDGTTPVKGTDYFTAADISEIQSIVETNIATLKSKDLIITGADGSDGKSAYELALDNGFVGTQEEWMDSLMPVAGEDFYTDAEITELKNQIVTQALSEIDVALKSITGSESLEESILNIESNITALKTQMTNIETEMDQTSVSTNNLEAQVNLVLEDVTDVKTKLATAINADADTEVSGTDDFSVFASAIDNIIVDKNSALSQLDTTKTQLNTANDTIDFLNTTLENGKTELATVINADADTEVSGTDDFSVFASAIDNIIVDKNSALSQLDTTKTQ
nr:hypothetical protein [Lachnospiraceae bacterium]